MRRSLANKNLTTQTSSYSEPFETLKYFNTQGESVWIIIKKKYNIEKLNV